MIHLLILPLIVLRFKCFYYSQYVSDFSLYIYHIICDSISSHNRIAKSEDMHFAHLYISMTQLSSQKVVPIYTLKNTVSSCFPTASPACSIISF